MIEPVASKSSSSDIATTSIITPSPSRLDGNNYGIRSVHTISSSAATGHPTSSKGSLGGTHISLSTRKSSKIDQLQKQNNLAKINNSKRRSENLKATQQREGSMRTFLSKRGSTRTLKVPSIRPHSIKQFSRLPSFRHSNGTSSTSEVASQSSASLSMRSSTSKEFNLGDIVEVKIKDVYVAGSIEREVMKGLYDVRLFGDNPAWRDLRNKIDVYYHHFRRYGTMPEVPSRQLRHFKPASPGEVIYTVRHNMPQKCLVISCKNSRQDYPLPRNMSYVVRFATKDGKNWELTERHVTSRTSYRSVADCT